MSDITKEYTAWTGMRHRCNCKTNNRYSDYGGRGISVCERWDSFETFLSDVGNAPSKDHSIDRIDNNGNYEPNNVRWATRTEQQLNRRKVKANHKLPKGSNHWTNKDKERAKLVAIKNIKNAHGCNENNSNAKITKEIAEKIRLEFNKNTNIRLVDLGKLFNLGREQTRKIVRGLAWMN